MQDLGIAKICYHDTHRRSTSQSSAINGLLSTDQMMYSTFRRKRRLYLPTIARSACCSFGTSLATMINNWFGYRGFNTCHLALSRRTWFMQPAYAGFSGSGVIFPLPALNHLFIPRNTASQMMYLQAVVLDKGIFGDRGDGLLARQIAQRPHFISCDVYVR